MWADFSGKAYTRQQLAARIAELKWTPGQWDAASPKMPQGIVLHNTAAPTLAQWAESGTAHDNRIKNLQAYYEGQGWHGGPHWFVSRDFITEFSNPLRRGTHSPSFNATHFGIEMVGDYAKEQFDTGDGAKVRDNAVFLMALICRKFGWDIGNVLKLHKEDKATSHDCPGKLVNKADVIMRVRAEVARQGGGAAPVVATQPAAPAPVAKIVGAQDTPAFRTKAPDIMRRLMADLKIGEEDAAAILGNIGVENGGFTLHLEAGKTTYDTTGFGWNQWTGSRRRDLDKWCSEKGYKPVGSTETDYDKACYAFLVHELTDTWEKKAIPKLKAAQGVEAKTISFMKEFERPGTPHEDRRVATAKLALALYRAQVPNTVPKVATSGTIGTGTIVAAERISKKSEEKGGGHDYALMIPILIVGFSLAAVGWFIWPKHKAVPVVVVPASDSAGTEGGAA